MPNTFFIKEYNIKIVDMWSIIDDSYNEIIDYVNLYNIGTGEKFSKDGKAIVLHHVLYSICTFLNCQDVGVKIIFYYNQHNKDGLVHNIAPHSKLIRIIKTACTLLPIKVFAYDIDYCDFIKKLNDTSTGDYRESILKLNSFIEKCDFSSFTFKKTIQFIRRNNLYLLDRQLLTNLKAKQFLLY